MIIFILEDDLHQMLRMERLVQAICMQKKINYSEIFSTGKPDQFLEKVRESGTNNLYLLDIEIKGAEQKGLEIGREIRKTDSTGVIAFITTHSEFSTLTYQYEVEAFDFIAKELPEEDMRQAVTKCVDKAASKNPRPVNHDAFFYEGKQFKLQIPFGDIYYFESGDSSHLIRIIASSYVTDLTTTLSKIEKMDPRLVRVHKSFVVNVENVLKVDKTNNIVYLIDGYQCEVSRRKMKYLLNKMDEMAQKTQQK